MATFPPLPGANPNQVLVQQLIRAFGVPHGPIPAEIATGGLGPLDPNVISLEEVKANMARQARGQAAAKARTVGPPKPTKVTPGRTVSGQATKAAKAAPKAGPGIMSRILGPAGLGLAGFGAQQGAAEVAQALGMPEGAEAMRSEPFDLIAGGLIDAITRNAIPVGDFISGPLQAPMLGGAISSLGLPPHIIAGAEAAGITPFDMMDLSPGNVARAGAGGGAVVPSRERTPVQMGGGAPTAPAAPVTSPFVPFNPLEANFPEVPDIEAILNELEAAAPLPPSEINRLPFILQGIAGGVRDVDQSVGKILLQAGLGALGGRGQFEQAKIEREDLMNTQSREFMRSLALARGQMSQQEFENLTQAEKARLEIERLNQAGRTAEAEQLQPSVSGRTVVTRKRKGDLIEHDISQIPSATEQTVSRLLPLISATAGGSIEDRFDSVLVENPDAVLRAANALNVAAEGGAKIQDVDKARIMQWLQTNEPDLMMDVQGQIQLKAILEALL